jgi:hypothetical protein
LQETGKGEKLQKQFLSRKKSENNIFFAGAQKNEIWATKNAQAWILVGLCLLLQETGKV